MKLVLALRHYANQPACPICISNPISHLLTVGSTPIQHSLNSVLNVKAVVVLVGAFSVIVQLLRLIVNSSNQDTITQTNTQTVTNTNSAANCVCSCDANNVCTCNCG